MPDVKASLRFLADLPIYHAEKPYLKEVPPDGVTLEPKLMTWTNWDFEEVEGITIRDVQDQIGNFSIDREGFEIVHHKSKHLALNDEASIESYQHEIETLLEKEYGAVFVKLFQTKVRVSLPLLLNSLE